MNRYQNDQERDVYRESDSSDEPRFDTDGTFTHSNFSFDRRNRFGEKQVRHDSYQDDQFGRDYDPTYKDQYGVKHPYEHGGKKNRWSDDIRSEASREGRTFRQGS